MILGPELIVMDGYPLSTESKTDLGIRGILLRGGVGGVSVKVAQILLTFGLTTYLARACGPEGYGVYVFVFAIIQLLSIPAEMGYQVLLVREVSAYSARSQWGELRGILRHGNLLVGIASILIATLAVGIGWLLTRAPSQMDNPMFATLVMGAVFLPLLTLANLKGAALRGFGNIVLGQFPGLVVRPGVFLLLAVIASLQLGESVLEPQLAMALHAVATGLALLTGGLLLRNRVPAQVKRAAAIFETKRWARSSLSLTFIAGMQVVNAQTDILMLGMFKSPEVVGVYRVAVQCGLVVVLGLQVVNLVAAPVMSRLYAKQDIPRLQVLAKLSARISLAAAIPVALLYFLFGERILGVVFGLEYTIGLIPLYILSLGQLINAAAGSIIMLLNMTGNEKSVMRGFMWSGGLNIVLNYLFIPRWGMVGAATATTISLVLWNIFLTRSAARDLNISCWAAGMGETAIRR